MGRTSNEVKQRWRKANCVQVNVAVPPGIAATFKARCLAEGVSIASELTRLMSGHYGSVVVKNIPDFSVQTRPKRRKSLAKVIAITEVILDAEQEYLHNIPDNLSGSIRYEAASQAVSALEEALDILRAVYE
jgi:hypothetical protein